MFYFVKVKFFFHSLKSKSKNNIEADTICAPFEGLLTDSTLLFLNTSYERTDYYNKKRAELTDKDNKTLIILLFY